jgi:hypothetical protein
MSVSSKHVIAGLYGVSFSNKNVGSHLYNQYGLISLSLSINIHVYAISFFTGLVCLSVLFIVLTKRITMYTLLWQCNRQSLSKKRKSDKNKFHKGATFSNKNVSLELYFMRVSLLTCYSWGYLFKQKCLPGDYMIFFSLIKIVSKGLKYISGHKLYHISIK